MVVTSPVVQCKLRATPAALFYRNQYIILIHITIGEDYHWYKESQAQDSFGKIFKIKKKRVLSQAH